MHFTHLQAIITFSILLFSTLRCGTALQICVSCVSTDWIGQCLRTTICFISPGLGQFFVPSGKDRTRNFGFFVPFAKMSRSFSGWECRIDLMFTCFSLFLQKYHSRLIVVCFPYRLHLFLPSQGCRGRFEDAAAKEQYITGLMCRAPTRQICNPSKPRISCDI